MLSTNTNFDAKHGVDYKTPMYTVHFDGETIDYCNHIPTESVGRVLLEDGSFLLL